MSDYILIKINAIQTVEMEIIFWDLSLGMHLAIMKSSVTLIKVIFRQLYFFKVKYAKSSLILWEIYFQPFK